MRICILTAGFLSGLLVLGLSTARAQPQATAEGVYRLEGKQIPLPEGVWRLAGAASYEVETGVPGSAVVSVALVRLRDAAVDAAMLIQVNRLGAPAIWGKQAACEREDLYFSRIRYASDHDGSCAYATDVAVATAPDAGIDPAWSRAMLRGAGLGWRFPSRWLEAAYRISDPRDAVQVRYLFDGSAAGKPRAAAVRALVAWTEASWVDVGSGFRNRLDPDRHLPDWRLADPVSVTPRPQIEAETDEAAHIGAKMVTYRIFGTLTDMTVNYLWLGSLPAASGLAAVSAVASSALYFVHELAWDRFDAITAVRTDLPSVGVEGPGPS